MPARAQRSIDDDSDAEASARQRALSCAVLAARSGRPGRVIERLALGEHHPATDLATRNRLRPLLAELGARLPPAELEAAQARGRAPELAALRQEDKALA
jgi:hypothetical protein